MKSACRPTLDDVARLAGVSLGSASRALSVPDQVKPATLAKVLQAVAQLGYVRNGAAQALASRRTCTVAAIYPTLGNPIFAMSIHALQQTLWAHGYQLLVASPEYEPEREIDVVRAVVERGVDAIVLVGTDHSDAVYELIRRHGLPYVLTWAHDDSRHAHCVGFSYTDAAYRMAQLVVGHGHTRIALCAGVAAGNERVRARVAATTAALASAGLILRPEWVIEQPFSFEGGREAVRQIVRQTAREIVQISDRPTALICGTDLHAIGAIDECRALGIRVPEDLSVTGFDDIEIAALSNPPLTTVRVPSAEIGVRAARRIVALLEGKSLSAALPLETEIVVRSSLHRIGPPRLFAGPARTAEPSRFPEHP